MPSADNAILYYEAAQSFVSMVALTDSGDQKFFKSADDLWSAKAGYIPEVKPDGVVSGLAIVPSSSADKIDVALGKVYQAGVLQDISAASDQAVTRPTLDYIKYSVTINDSQVITLVAGAEHASAFSDTRGADGGPPLIPVGSVEIGQVHLSSSETAVILSSEIKQVQGSSQERYDYPVWNEKRINVENGVLSEAGVEFISSLPATHVGVIPKGVYAEYYVPIFAELSNSVDFVPVETTHSTSSKPVYGNTLGSSSASLSASSFTCYVNNGISDSVIQQKNQNIMFKFKQDRLNDPYLLQQGKFGITRAFPAGDLISLAATISGNEAAVEVYN